MVRRASEAAEQLDREKSKRVGALSQLWPFLAPYKLLVLGALMALVLTASVSLILPMAVRRVVDQVLAQSPGFDIDAYFIGLLGVVAILAISSALRFYGACWLSERVVADLKQDVFGKLLQQSASFYDRSHTGEIMSHLSSDTTIINTAIRANVSQAMRNLVIFAGGLILMVVSSPALSFLIICALPLVVFPLVFFGRSVRRLSEKSQDMMAYLHQYGAEMLSNVRMVQGFNSERTVLSHFVSRNEDSVAAGMKRIKARAFLTAVAIFLVMASIVFIIWYGARDVMSGSMSAGQLVQFMLYAVFAGGALAGLSEVWGEVAQAAGAMERLSSFLDLEPEVKEEAHPIKIDEPIQGALAFREVDFAYPGRADRSVLRDVSFVLKPGERVAIVGQSGAGKSTIFHLLLRFYDPYAGQITLDGVPVQRLSLPQLRSAFALVPQEPRLFHGTIAENIAFARPGAGMADVVLAAQVAQADEFISRFHDGYETMVGEGGMTLSGGQRQRIALARAVLADAPILLLDEATSALDTGSEEKVQIALEETMKNRTSLIIAHRLSTVQEADRILVMEEGRVVEMGRHDELVALGGIYAGLASRQLQGC